MRFWLLTLNTCAVSLTIETSRVRFLLFPFLRFATQLFFASHDTTFHLFTFCTECSIHIWIHHNFGEILHLMRTEHTISINIARHLRICNNFLKIIHKRITCKVLVVVQTFLHLVQCHSIYGKVADNVLRVFLLRLFMNNLTTLLTILLGRSVVHRYGLRCLNTTFFFIYLH